MDTELAVMQGYRLLESESGHFLCEDWISNTCFMYVFDMIQDQYLWTNRAYPRFRKDLNATIEEGALRFHEEFGTSPPPRLMDQTLSDQGHVRGKPIL